MPEAPSPHGSVLIALGSNLGDRAALLAAARADLARLLDGMVASPVYETRPMYVTDQPAFLNQVVAGDTGLGPADLLAALKRLETAHGRRPGPRFGPRPLDLDILLYGQDQVHAPGLDIPHPRMAERAFVLVPAADIVPDLRHPATGRTVAQMLAALGAAERQSVRRLPP